MKGLYIVTHDHRHGTSTYLVECLTHTPTEDEVIDACDIDFEPDREEFIGIEATDIDARIP